MSTMTWILITLSVVEVLALVLVLATYLIIIARRLRTISRTLGLVDFGVRAIEKQTEPVDELLSAINTSLEGTAEVLGIMPQQKVHERERA